MGLPVGRGWRPVMLKDGVMVDEQSMTCNTPLRPLLRLDGRLERPPPINRLVTSSPSTYMIAPNPIALMAIPNPFYHMGARRRWLRVYVSWERR